MIVVDANVVVVFLLESPLAPHARAIHARDAGWITHPLCRSEVLNALLHEAKARKIELRDAIDAAGTAVRLLAERMDGCEPSAILTTAHSSGLTAYDATYVVLARSLGVPLVTEDRQILRACPDVARSMRQFLEPPEKPLAAREQRATYKIRRAGKRTERGTNR